MCCIKTADDTPYCDSSAREIRNIGQKGFHVEFVMLMMTQQFVTMTTQCYAIVKGQFYIEF